MIPRADFDGSKMGEKYYLGKCNAEPCTNPVLPSDPADCTPPLPEEAALPPAPDSLIDEVVTIKANEVQTCSDGSILSGSTEESKNVSIKRVRIANATTAGGVFDANTLAYDSATKGTKVRYGTKTAGAVILTPYEFKGTTYTPEIKKGQATGVKITGATIEEAYVDLLVDYICEPIAPDTTCNSEDGISKVKRGEVKSISNGIAVRGGITDGKVKPGTITSGMITSGTDASGNPMRGRITSGAYKEDLVNRNADGTENMDILTKGRRTQGKLINATVVNARTTTVKGITIVDDGIIIEGEMDPTVTTKTFGTVTNATVVGNVISNSNTCFSSGTVGSRGQLNWKEVVK
jgi:hypothetical protein